MRDQVLQWIIELTSHRDLDSLDHGLVITLRDLMQLESIVLGRMLREDRLESLEEVIRLDTTSQGQIRVTHAWKSEDSNAIEDADAHRCLAEQTVVARSSEGRKHAWIPISNAGKPLGVLGLGYRDDTPVPVDLINGIADIYGNYVAVLMDSERDNLTGLLNRKTFDNKLNRLLTSQRENRDELADIEREPERRHPDQTEDAWLAILDIDHFKRVNDTYGHVYGDEILLTLSQRMKDSFRKVDLLFRVGGEEFVIILAPIAEEKAYLALDRFREQIADHHFPQVGSITVSIGYAKVQEGDYPRRIYDLADKALYFAKEHGRNQVCRYEDLVEQGALEDVDASGTIELF